MDYRSWQTRAAIVSRLRREYWTKATGQPCDDVPPSLANEELERQADELWREAQRWKRLQRGRLASERDAPIRIHIRLPRTSFAKSPATLTWDSCGRPVLVWEDHEYLSEDEVEYEQRRGEWVEYEEGTAADVVRMWAQGRELSEEEADLVGAFCWPDLAEALGGEGPGEDAAEDLLDPDDAVE